MTAVVAVHLRAEHVGVARPLRARTHKAHVSTHDVEELRQLVHRAAAEQRAEPRASVGTLDTTGRDVDADRGLVAG